MLVILYDFYIHPANNIDAEYDNVHLLTASQCSSWPRWLMSCVYTKGTVTSYGRRQGMYPWVYIFGSLHVYINVSTQFIIS